MKIEKRGTIILNDNNRYVVASMIDYENKTYVYLVDINNNANIKFCLEKNENEQIKMIEIDDVELIKKLIPLFARDT